MESPLRIFMLGVALVLTTTLVSFHGVHGRPNNADSPTTVSPFEDVVTTIGSILEDDASEMEDTTTTASGMIIDIAQQFPPP